MGNMPGPGDSERQFREDVLPAELKYIEAWRHATHRDGHDLTGLALSGGGIRSAVFCLGVLQALAKHDILKNFDYLSTVSGGGYIGSSLTWFTRSGMTRSGVGPQSLPYGIDDPMQDFPKEPPGRPLLPHLRRHGSYLDPNGTISMLAGVAIVLRGLLLNLLVWLPLAVTAFVLLRLIYRAVAMRTAYDGYVWLKPLVPAALLAAIFVLMSIRYSLRSGRQDHKHEDMSYASRRGFETHASKLLHILIWLLPPTTLPYVMQALHASPIGTGSLGTIGTVAGAATGLWSRLVPKGGKADTAVTWAGPIGAALLIYGVGLLAYALSGAVLVTGQAMVRLYPSCAAIAAAIVAAAIGYCVDLNETTLHRFYRDRLMEAFMPDTDPPDVVPTGRKAQQADASRIRTMCDRYDPRAPYHLINANLVLTDVRRNDEDPGWADRWRIRGGDNFVFAPRYSGGRAAGWHDTAGNKALSEISLPTAMAVSGAAVNPNAASDGSGPQRNRLFALLMALLNIRLGYWLANPNRYAGKAHARAPNHFDAARWLIAGASWTGRFLELTDGGNFENLAVYELLHRKVRTIVVCDAGADPQAAFADLQNLLNRAAADFHVIIDFPSPPLAAFMPLTQSGRFPLRVPFATAPFVVGNIRYEDGSSGKIYYIKPAIFADLRLTVLGFKGANADFPDDTTLNQFFDEARFEAYRELGFACADKMLEDPTINAALSAM